MRSVLIWTGLIAVLLVPVVAAAASPLLAWREPVYIVAGFAGIVAMALMPLQPFLAAGSLPGVPIARSRRIHRIIGFALVALVLLHVFGLWITSPPDVVDALLLVSPTPFSLWGVIAMWGLAAAALLALLRKRLALRSFRIGHTALVITVVLGTVAHALLIEGTMEQISKLVLCAVLLAATAWAVLGLRAWVVRPRADK
jgi:predicted ferric reductase